MKSKIIAVWMCAVLVFSGAVVMMGNEVNAGDVSVGILGGGTFGGGDGSIGNPYIIEDALDLQAMNTGTSSHYILGNDIDASATVTWNAGAGFIPCPGFWGSLNGAGYTVYDLTVNSASSFEDLGLFAALNGASAVSNLNMVNCTINGRGQGHYAGMIVGVFFGGTIKNCRVNGNVMIWNLGGGSHAGGLAGYVDTGCIISNSSSTGTVSGSDYAGGLAGRAYGTISNCYSTSIVVGNASGYRSGGFIGENGGPVTNCYSTGSASTGPSGAVGGFIGVNSGTATGCYWDTKISGLITSAGGTGRTTAQMKTQSTFTGWDFTTVWHMKQGITYPLSQSEPLPPFSGGDGSAANPYIITDVWELQNMTLELGANYTIANDFDAGISVGWNGGQGFNPIGNATLTPFTGSLDGQNRTVTGLFINRTGGLMGLFGTIAQGASVTNLNLIGCNVTGTGNYVGMLAGVNKGTVRWVDTQGTVKANTYAGGLLGTNDASATLSDCTSAGTVTAALDHAGGIAGYSNSHVTNCTSWANATAGSHYAGGLLGECTGNSLQVTDCHAYGSATASIYAGGLVGENTDSIITSCTASGPVNCTNSVGGGLVGISGGTISHCSASGDVLGYGNMGGLVGTNNGIISQSDASGTVTAPTADSAGGLVGYNMRNITWCHASGNVSGRNYLGGLVGSNIGGNVTNSSATGNVTGESYLGGLAGVNGPGAVLFRSWSSGTVSGVSSIGGLVGDNLGPIGHCHSESDATGTGNQVGGLVGNSVNVIMNSYSRGNATGNQNVGGLVGYTLEEVSYCYATGLVTGNADVGGLIGQDDWGATNSYYDRNTTGMSDVGKGIPKTTAEMMQQATFAGWDFATIWDIKETFTYPFFIWQQFNTAPLAQDDRFTVDEDSIRGGNVTHDNGFGPDIDPDGGPLTVTALNGDPGALMFPFMIPSGAWVTLEPNGTFTYIPAFANQALAPGQWLHDTFTYTVRDANMTTDTATVTVNITGLNDAPVMANAGDTVDFNEDGAGVIIDPDITVSDVDNANLAGAWVNITGNYQVSKDVLEFTDTAGITGTYAMGNLHLTGTDTVANYVAALRSVRFNNSASNPTTAPRTITWFATDGLLWGMTTSSVTINDANDAPIAANDTEITDEDTPFDTSDVTANDSDPDMIDTLSVINIDTAGTIGIPVHNGDNTINYDPNSQFEYLGAGETGYDFFNYTVSDGNGGTDTGMVQINITGVNDAPILDSIGNKMVSESVQLIFTVTATDPENDQLSFSLEPSFPVGASIHGDSGEFTWTPAEDQGPGFYNITIRVTDNGTPNLFDNETIMVTVGEVNNAPVLAAIGNRAVNELALLTFIAAATDADLPVNTLTYTLDAGAPAGAGIDPATGVFTWTPTEAQGPGVYSITIRVSDGTAEDSETVSVTVNEVNVAPVLGAIGNRVIPEVSAYTFTATATDPDLPTNTLTFSLDAGAPTGASITAGGLFAWTPTEAQGPGNYTVTVRVTDGAAEDFETFNIEVLEVNGAPQAADDSVSVNEDAVTPLAVLVNDIDPDADTLSIISVTQGAHGTVTITGGGTGLTYTPDADYFGTDTFTYRISDGLLNSTAAVAVTVNPVNDDPTAADDTAFTDEDRSVSVPVLANDGILPDVGETLTVQSATDGAHGTVTINAAGTEITYVPEANFHDTDTFTYTVSDGNGGTATATVTVTVNPVNDAPLISTTGTASAVAGETYTVDFNAADVDGDALTWSVSGASWLTVDAATGVLNGTAAAGIYNIIVIVTDGNDGWDTSAYRLTVVLPDADGDGVPDDQDEFPNDASETVDTDSNGVGNNADDDDDGDGTPDDLDSFPLNAAEDTDTDNDGIGNNADPDDDGDAVPDDEDPEPLNAAVTGNEYDPGWPYWGILAVIAVTLIIGLAGLAVFRFLIRQS